MPSCQLSGASQSLKKRSSSWGRSAPNRRIRACGYAGGAPPLSSATPSRRRIVMRRPISSSQFVSLRSKCSSEAIQSRLRSKAVGSRVPRSASATALARLFHPQTSCRSFTIRAGHSYLASCCSVPSTRARRRRIGSSLGDAPSSSPATANSSLRSRGRSCIASARRPKVSWSGARRPASYDRTVSGDSLAASATCCCVSRRELRSKRRAPSMDRAAPRVIAACHGNRHAYRPRHHALNPAEGFYDRSSSGRSRPGLRSRSAGEDYGDRRALLAAAGYA